VTGDLAGPPVVTGAADLGLAMLALGVLLAIGRLVRGPTLSDRVVAVDLIASLAVAMLAVAAVRFQDVSLLQPALVLTLVAFVGTLAFARYVGRRTRT
jgi:multicomponent Na+:H+ antiporter subunit F